MRAPGLSDDVNLWHESCSALGVAPRVFRRWWFWTAIGLAVLAVTVVVGFIAAVPMSSDTLRRRMIATLSERLDSAVELGDLQVRVFPGLRAEGKDLIIRKNGRTDVPPLIAIKGFSVDATMTGLLAQARGACSARGARDQRAAGPRGSQRPFERVFRQGPGDVGPAARTRSPWKGPSSSTRWKPAMRG